LKIRIKTGERLSIPFDFIVANSFEGIGSFPRVSKSNALVTQPDKEALSNATIRTRKIINLMLLPIAIVQWYRQFWRQQV